VYLVTERGQRRRLPETRQASRAAVWSPLIDRLFRHVGLAAIVLESFESDVNGNGGRYALSRRSR